MRDGHSDLVCESKVASGQGLPAISYLKVNAPPPPDHLRV